MFCKRCGNFYVEGGCRFEQLVSQNLAKNVKKCIFKSDPGRKKTQSIPRFLISVLCDKIRIKSRFTPGLFTPLR